MRARVLPATASDVPRSPSRDDSDATTQPCARVRRISVPSNIFYIEPAGSRVRRNHADSSLTPTDARTGRVHEMTHERPARPSTWLSCALAPDQIRTGIPFEVCDLSYSLLANRSQLPLPLAMLLIERVQTKTNPKLWTQKNPATLRATRFLCDGARDRIRTGVRVVACGSSYELFALHSQFALTLATLSEFPESQASADT